MRANSETSVPRQRAPSICATLCRGFRSMVLLATTGLSPMGHRVLVSSRRARSEGSPNSHRYAATIFHPFPWNTFPNQIRIVWRNNLAEASETAGR